jgi:hypothetical protein
MPAATSSAVDSALKTVVTRSLLIAHCSCAHE